MRFRTLTLLFVLTACVEEEPRYLDCNTSPQSGDGVSFDADQMACVKVTMKPADFESLSNQYRFEGEEKDQWPGVIRYAAMSCSEPYPNGYSYLPADVSVDGWQALDVGIRRKGFIGSVVGANARPSLKIKTDEYIEDQQMGDTERVTLNNNHQDASRMRTCLTYSVFEDAGYPVPRCNLANVSVNGSGLGTYTHIEAVKKRFLRREFGNDDGDLYEGALADFTDPHLAGLPDTLGRFEAKTGDTDESGSGLLKLTAALQVDDADLELALTEVLDLDAFMLFWALETVVNHNDGYAANTNNFYIYFDPDRGDRGVFIPWGADQAMYDWDRIKTTSELTRRLSRVPHLRQRYLDELQWVLEEVWDEGVLSERIDAFAAQVATAERDTPYQKESTRDLRSWVQERRAHLDDFIADDGEVGAKEMGPCTGATDPEDFMLAAEVVTVTGAACSVVPRNASGALLFALGLLALRRRGQARAR